ncbi:cytochrome P450 [Cyathus striatus]|nr:cytochrome P450 [Cyathus striatus]
MGFYLNIALAISSFFFCLLCVSSTKRLFYHPLSRFPGPPAAAITLLYKAYFDIILDGGWAEHLEYLHDIYGTIIRVGPNELHFSEPSAYNEIYGMGTKFSKHPAMYSSFATDLSVFALFDHHEATQRRNLIGPFFSRRAILNLENTVRSKVDGLISRLLMQGSSKKSADLDLAFRSTSLDIITSYCFASKTPSNQAPHEFQKDILASIDGTLPMIWVFKHFPFIKYLLLGVPEIFASVLKPSTVGILEQRRQMGKQIDYIMKDPSSLDNVDHETIYHYFLNPQEDNQRLPPITREWLLDEGLYMRFAAGDTVGNTCTVAAYHVLTNEHVHKTLTQELREAWPDKDLWLGLESLEKLPYLTAVIKESLRMAHGVVTPLPRVIGPHEAEISGTIIPPGTVVSMGAMIMHRNPRIFTDPSRFYPERWLQDDSQGLEKYLVSFSKGPRSCLGINLAWCELYLIIGAIFRRLDMEADSPSPENVSFREYFVPLHRGKHLQAFISSQHD